MRGTRRVVITGLGLISPVGNSVDQAWQNILEGKSGISTIDTFDVEKITSRIAGLIRDFNCEHYGITSKQARQMDNFVLYGLAAAQQAVQDAGLQAFPDNAARIGVSVGSGIGGLSSIEKNCNSLTLSGPRKVSPFFIPATVVNMVAGQISIQYGFKGPNYSFSTACTTGGHGVGSAARTIAYGDADVMISGGAEASATRLGMAGFAAARALSTRNDEPERASRPWDKDRDGFVLSDGSAVLVLEELEHAKARGAKIYAELTGFGMSGDAYHITSPSEGGQGAGQAMIAAMEDAQLNPEDISYVNAHGTSTQVGDIGETLAIKYALKDAAYKTPVSSTKSMTGHLLGAAGAIEAVFSALAIQNQIAPPTINLDNPDEQCDLDYIPHTPREMEIKHVISNSFGFGGTNASLVFSKI